MTKKISTILLVFITANALWFIILPDQAKSFWKKLPPMPSLLAENRNMRDKAKIIAMSYYFPDFKYFAQIVQGSKTPEARYMNGYHMVDNIRRAYIFKTYYGKLLEIYPDHDAGHSLYAFCLFHQGDLAGAKEHYAKALQANPSFFWHYYNLGVVLLRHSEFASAAGCFERAMALRPETVVGTIYNSGIYRQIWKGIPDPQGTMWRNIMTATQEIKVFLTTAQAFNDHKATTEDLRKIIAAMTVRIF